MPRCSYCQGEGHYKTTCPQKLADKQNRQRAQLEEHAGRIGALEGQVASFSVMVNRLEWASGLRGLIAGSYLKFTGTSPHLMNLSWPLAITVSLLLGWVAGFSMKKAASLASLFG